MFVDWILPLRVMNVGHDIRLTRHDTTTDMSDGRCLMRSHCILWEWQQTTQVAAMIASSPSGASTAGQSVSDSRTLGTCRRHLATAAASPAIRLYHGTTGGWCGHRRR